MSSTPPAAATKKRYGSTLFDLVATALIAFALGGYAFDAHMRPQGACKSAGYATGLSTRP